MTKQFSMELAGRTLMVEVGRVAAQANGAAFMLYYLQQQHLKSQEMELIFSH